MLCRYSSRIGGKGFKRDEPSAVFRELTPSAPKRHDKTEAVLTGASTDVKIREF